MRTFGASAKRGLTVFRARRRLGVVLSTAQSGNLQESYITGKDGTREFFGAFWAAQTFTPAAGHTITLVKLQLARKLLPGTVKVSIRATAADLPTGADLVSIEFNGDLLSLDPSEGYKVLNLPPQLLTVSVKYAIVVRAVGGDATNLIAWGLDGTSPTYAGGERCDSSNSGGAWTNATGDDFMFQEYGS